MLTAPGCQRWDQFVTTNYRTVYWLTGVLGPAEVPTYLAISSSGHSTLMPSFRWPLWPKTHPREINGLRGGFWRVSGQETQCPWNRLGPLPSAAARGRE